MKKIEGGVTAARGFLAAGCAAGIKKSGKADMAMIYSQSPCIAAGTFTKNLVKAAPVKWDQNLVGNMPKAQAIVCNSGVANACTGAEGEACCRQMAEAVANALQILPEEVLVASTGVIGKQLPMDKICEGIQKLKPLLAETKEAANQAARAIMTTDTKEKEIAVSFEIGDQEVRIGGCAKGSGMIHPNMCTMLAFITTDMAISKDLLQKALSRDIEDTYNMISVDGDTSTNDTVLLLANGCAQNEEVCEESEEFDLFCKALHMVNEFLAKAIAGDGEGATALLEARVMGAKTREDARLISKAIITSTLTKAAIFGHDANWGRILCAMGYSGGCFDPDLVDLYLESDKGGVKIMGEGKVLDYSEEEATEVLSSEAVTILADLNMGDEEAFAWGCDLTYDYVKINADYRS